MCGFLRGRDRDRRQVLLLQRPHRLTFIQRHQLASQHLALGIGRLVVEVHQNPIRTNPGFR